jgi:dienelactone hydrolase
MRTNPSTCKSAAAGGSVRHRAVLVVATALLALASQVARPQSLTMETFPPEQGKGAVVVVVSGASGTAMYRDTARKLSGLGYFAVLVDGSSIYKRYAPANFDGRRELQTVLSEARSAPQALPGKAALLGFSLGGAAVLVHGAQMKNDIAAVAAYYPAITPLGPDFTSLAASFQVPVLLIAGEQDRYADCCLVASMRSLAAATSTAPVALVTYPRADHGFNLEETQFAYLPQEAADAWDKVVSFLNGNHPARGIP